MTYQLAIRLPCQDITTEHKRFKTQSGIITLTEGEVFTLSRGMLDTMLPVDTISSLSNAILNLVVKDSSLTITNLSKASIRHDFQTNYNKFKIIRTGEAATIDLSHSFEVPIYSYFPEPRVYKRLPDGTMAKSDHVTDFMLMRLIPSAAKQAVQVASAPAITALTPVAAPKPATAAPTPAAAAPKPAAAAPKPASAAPKPAAAAPKQAVAAPTPVAAAPYGGRSAYGVLMAPPASDQYILEYSHGVKNQSGRVTVKSIGSVKMEIGKAHSVKKEDLVPLLKTKFDGDFLSDTIMNIVIQDKDTIRISMRNQYANFVVIDPKNNKTKLATPVDNVFSEYTRPIDSNIWYDPTLSDNIYVFMIKKLASKRKADD